MIDCSSSFLLNPTKCLCLKRSCYVLFLSALISSEYDVVCFVFSFVNCQNEQNLFSCTSLVNWWDFWHQVFCIELFYLVQVTDFYRNWEFVKLVQWLESPTHSFKASLSFHALSFFWPTTYMKINNKMILSQT